MFDLDFWSWVLVIGLTGIALYWSDREIKRGAQDGRK